MTPKNFKKTMIGLIVVLLIVLTVKAALGF